MYVKTIINPETNRENKVRCWKIDAQALYAELKSGSITSSKDISWALLSDDASYQLMQDEEHGESAKKTLRCRSSRMHWTGRWD